MISLFRKESKALSSDRKSILSTKRDAPAIAFEWRSPFCASLRLMQEVADQN
jgi:hypothetical protein